MSEALAGACHCGAVRLRVRLVEGGLSRPRRCTCSYCRMRGAVALSAPLDGVEVVEGEEVLSTYRFNTGVARHHFCSVCGVHTHHRRRSNPDQYAVNAAVLEGVSPFDFAEVPVNDGERHPSDHPDGGGPVGVLRFERLR